MEKITVGPMPYMSVMPTVLVGANVKGKPNYMTAAWATVACMAPPMVCVALNKERYTVKGIEENRTFSLNVPSVKQVVEADHCGLVSGTNEDKSKVFRSYYGTLKTAPLAEECPVNIECRLFKSVDCGSHRLVHRRSRGDPCRHVLPHRRETGYRKDQPDYLRPGYLFWGRQTGRERILGREGLPEEVKREQTTLFKD